jgi:hypothetical protein
MASILLKAGQFFKGVTDTSHGSGRVTRMILDRDQGDEVDLFSGFSVFRGPELKSASWLSSF